MGRSPWPEKGRWKEEREREAWQQVWWSDSLVEDVGFLAVGFCGIWGHCEETNWDRSAIHWGAF